jgi:hypothetical protein
MIFSPDIANEFLGTLGCVTLSYRARRAGKSLILPVRLSFQEKSSVFQKKSLSLQHDNIILFVIFGFHYFKFPLNCPKSEIF